ncbi:hypothetical protein [Nocardia sp. NPDC051832]|uniref:hypothetical protein n=1 Tax=Nocardia sp. NPDC051832 TaxID=3155673 RepID=UPI0034498F53
MRIRMSATVAMLALLATGCGTLRADKDVELSSGSTHTAQELCEFPTRFFATQLELDNLRSEVLHAGSKDKSQAIGFTKVCGYFTADSSHIGDIMLGYSAPASAPTTSQSLPNRTLTIDGVTVFEFPRPVLSPAGPSGSAPVELVAEIDGWEGRFYFPGGDEPAIQAAARMLLDMIKSLRG